MIDHAYSSPMPTRSHSSLRRKSDAVLHASLTSLSAYAMIPQMRRYLVYCGISLFLAACQTSAPVNEEVKPKEEKKESVYYIGTVHKIYADSKFALVRVVKSKPPAGTTLISHPVIGAHVRMANLIVSNESMNNSITPLIAADIRSGDVAVGDAVYIYQALGAPTPDLVKGGAAQADLEKERAILAAETQLTPDTPPAVTDPSPTEATQPHVEELTPVEPAMPMPPEKDPVKIPDRIKEIPRNIEDWD